LYHLKQIQHNYGNLKALALDKLHINRNESLGIVGPNGSGKTTLLKILACAESPTQGTIYFNGQPVSPFSPSIRFKVCMLPQSSCLLNRTVAENIAYGFKLRKDKYNQHNRIMAALDAVGLDPGCFAQRHQNELSGGEKRRVALAARLALQPEVLILDEPTAGIDIESAIRIQETIIKIKRHTTLIIASHDHEWLSEICNKQIFLFQGNHIGARRMNIFLGPYIQINAHQWQKKGTPVLVSLPPAPDAIALIDPMDITITLQKPDIADNKVALKGQITRLIARSQFIRVSISILIGQIQLFAEISTRNVNFFPGQHVYAIYHLHRIKWVRRLGAPASCQ